MSRRLRVLSISTLFPCPARPGFGGFVANAMTAVAPLGEIDLTVLNPIGLPPWPLSRREPYRALAATPAITTVDALTVHHPRFLALPALADGNPARLARATLPLVQQLQAAEPFDLVDAQFFFPDGPAAHTIARTLGLPLVIKARGADIHYWSARPAARRQILAAGAYAARLLAVSASLAEAMRGIGLPGETIRIHHTGLDHARFFPRPRARARAECGAALGLNAPADAPLFACVGALIPRKGQEYAIRALAELPAAHLALAGAGPDEARLRALAAELGVTARGHVLGQVSHETLPVLLAAADALVLPSASEGLANVWVEALACGTPIVIPAIGGAREVVTAPAAGRIVPREAGAIAAALRGLLASPPSQQEVAAHAARFSWEAHARELAAHWRAVVGA